MRGVATIMLGRRKAGNRSPTEEPKVCMTRRWREMDSNLQYRAVNEEVLTADTRICWCGGAPSNGGMIFTTTPRRALQEWCAAKHVCDPVRVRECGRRLPRGGSGEPCWRARRSITKTRGRGWIVIGGNNGLGVGLRRRMPRVALSGIALRLRVGAALMVSLVFSVCESTANSLAHFCPAFWVFRFRGYRSNWFFRVCRYSVVRRLDLARLKFRVGNILVESL